MRARWRIDLGKPDSAKRLMADLAANGEKVATLINNAGFGVFGKFAKAEPGAASPDDRPQLRHADRPLPRGGARR